MDRKTRLALELVVLAGLVTCLVPGCTHESTPPLLASEQIRQIAVAKMQSYFEVTSTRDLGACIGQDRNGRLHKHCRTVEVSGGTTADGEELLASVIVDAETGEVVMVVST